MMNTEENRRAAEDEEARLFAGAMKSGELYEAQTRLEQMREDHPDSARMRIYEVWLMAQSGQLHEALQSLVGQDDDQANGLRATCLRMLGDPLWEGVATSLLDCADPDVRAAMQTLLALPRPSA